MRWLIPTLIVPMLIAGACRGDSKQLSVSQAEDVITESSVEGRALAPFETTENDSAVGKLAPIATGVDLLTNELVRIAPEGRPLVVAFFAHWCPHCQREVEALTEWLLANKLPSNVDLFAISTFEAPERGNHPPSRWFKDEGGSTPSSPIQVLWRFQMPLVSRQSHILCLLRLTGQWLFASVETLVRANLRLL